MSPKQTIQQKAHTALYEQQKHTMGQNTPEPTPFPDDAQKRAWVQHVHPELDGGKWPAKCVLDDLFTVEADIVSDGHDQVGGILSYRHSDSDKWRDAAFQPVVNDRFRASFRVSQIGLWHYRIEAWIDQFATWRIKCRKKVEAGQDVALELLAGAELVTQAAARASGTDRELLNSFATAMRATDSDTSDRVDSALGKELATLVATYPDRKSATRYDRGLEVQVDRDIARFSTWYEIFPRSTGTDRQHGTFKDLERYLPYIASMGFDVLYLPPIHPIGVSHRKGKNNSLVADDSDPGSPWAIGNANGGHKSIHPELGTLTDFGHLVSSAQAHGLEVALDIALQVSPDHPYVAEHPEWFPHRPDGTIQHAENPPKKYEDIYPFDFNCRDWKALWLELHSIFVFWIETGVRIFRVDNPHTKPLSFWAWCIRDLKMRYPDVLFLAEAFTRPKLMYALAKAGFSQSYTYFTWRNSSWEFREYLEELTQTEVQSFFRPNFWPNTPDILPEHLQHGGRPAFIARFVLAATLSSNYGIYGPAFELMEHVARPGSEEYIDNEKYELKEWDIDSPDSLRPIISRVNKVRRDHRSLQSNSNLHFHNSDNEHLLCYSKHSEDGNSRILVIVNMDFHNVQSGWVDVDLGFFGMDWDGRYQVHDVLSDARYMWRGPRNYVQLNPHVMPAHVFTIRPYVRSENEFDYFA